MNGDLIDRLRIVEPADYGTLTQNPDGTYTAAQVNQVYPETQQGMLEESNVNLQKEMTSAMEVQRAFQSCGKALSIIDQMNQKTANDIGKL